MMRSMNPTLRTSATFPMLGPVLGFVAAAALVLAGCSKESKSNGPADTPGAKPAANGTDKVGAPPLPPVNLGNPDQPGISRVSPRSKVPVITPTAPGGDSTYLVSLEVPEAVTPGAESVALVKVVPKTGWKMNFEFPTRLQIEPPEGVTVLNPKQSREDAQEFEEKGATFAIKFKADSAGAKDFTGKFSFAVCTDATCDPKRSELAWSTKVE